MIRTCLSTVCQLQCDAGGQGPPLWAVAELAAPIGQKLRKHFAGGLATDRIDRPEWMFNTVAKVGPPVATIWAAHLPWVVFVHDLCLSRSRGGNRSRVSGLALRLWP